MTLEVTHATPADDTFSSQGAAAWNAGHTVTARGGIAVFDNLTTGTDADTTMVTNSAYVVDMSAWATADRSYTLPTDATVGDRISVQVLAGDASHELILKTGTGQTCAFAGSTIAAATEITRLFITGESLLFRYVATNKWLVETDGRIPQTCLMRLSTSTSNTEAANTFTRPTQTGTPGVWTADVDNASLAETTADRIKTRRAGEFIITGSYGSTQVVTAANYAGFAIMKNGYTSILFAPTTVAPTAGLVLRVGETATSVPLAVDDTIAFVFRSQEGSRGCSAFASPRLDTHFAMTEILA
jgi:hypothetical protein